MGDAVGTVTLILFVVVGERWMGGWVEALLGLRKVVRLVRLMRLLWKRPRRVYAKALDLAEDAGSVHQASDSDYQERRAYGTGLDKAAAAG